MRRRHCPKAKTNNGKCIKETKEATIRNLVFFHSLWLSASAFNVTLVAKMHLIFLLFSKWVHNLSVKHGAQNNYDV